MPEFEVFWTHTAGADLDAIVEYIANDDALTALQQFDRLQHRAQSLEHHPRRGRRVPELCGLASSGYRELIEPPWRLVYRVEPQRVIVLAVLDSRRDLLSVLFERLVRS